MVGRAGVGRVGHPLLFFTKSPPLFNPPPLATSERCNADPRISPSPRVGWGIQVGEPSQETHPAKPSPSPPPTLLLRLNKGIRANLAGRILSAGEEEPREERSIEKEKGSELLRR
ncbi:hypothetical protein IE53DRAFT_388120 [Violaceomyces palustris]|uniref:Uncharacterized protein n=1 Tax=Violaceomyces palustris TaxID=1673888 RepID=A0ACD0NV02_9BASI|nr:hypothetical protein IE53DRAFT_388120 [Violaceomyces palustris]